MSAVTRLFSAAPAARRHWGVSSDPVRYAGAVLAIAAGYYVCAAGGKALLLTGPAGEFWPAAGFAVAVLYLGGLRWWPGVLLGDVGSLLSDVLSEELAVPVGTALAQAVGDMTGLLVAALILQQLAGPRAAMDRLGQVGAVLVAVATGAAISATVAMTSARVGGLISAPDMTVFWRSWWLGDLAGALVVLPLALAWAWPPAWRTARAGEGALMIVTVFALSVIAVSISHSSLYLVFPAFTWAALRFGPRGATLAVAMAVVIAVWATSKQLGPFVEHSATSDALNLQLFIAVAALTTLCLAAIISERQRAADELARARARNATAAGDERRRIQDELHDSAQNRLIALTIRLRIAEEQQHAPEDAAVLEGFIADAEDVIEDLRRIAHGVSPPNLAADGLVDALRAECAASALAVQLTADAIERSAPEVETAVYLCCLEAVQNASKHAGRDASVQIDLRRDGADLAFSIHDTGSGFDPAAVNGRRARMASSHARVHAIGGRVDIESSPGSGTTVTGLAPWPPRRA